MPGFTLLEGGAEFGGRMAEPDLRAIVCAGGLDAPIRIIPAAAAPDNNQQRAGQNGVRWFRSLGATDVEVVPLLDKATADDQEIAETLRAARLIYLLGGFTHHLAQSLLGSAAWDAALDAQRLGAVIAGSSAGAMVLCQYYRRGEDQVELGLGLVSGACVLPHHDTFGRRWAARLRAQLPDATLIGIDERTGMIDDGTRSIWTVLGQGHVTLYAPQGVSQHSNGETLALPAPSEAHGH